MPCVAKMKKCIKHILPIYFSVFFYSVFRWSHFIQHLHFMTQHQHDKIPHCLFYNEEEEMSLPDCIVFSEFHPVLKQLQLALFYLVMYTIIICTVKNYILNAVHHPTSKRQQHSNSFFYIDLNPYKYKALMCTLGSLNLKSALAHCHYIHVAHIPIVLQSVLVFTICTQTHPGLTGITKKM